ncbi:MAG TPA: hypothetical protein VG753_01790 [Candidatus Paceibacterota bacterium]|nr:hypothetical protein [Candidatus Paceibacterota bacterium]
MKVLLTCTQCNYAEWGTTDGDLMNKIIMWNHVRKAHADTAEYILRTYQTVPNDFYDVRSAPAMA